MSPTSPSDSRDGAASGGLRSIGRYEFKYLLDPDQAASLRSDVAARLPGDAHGSAYTVWSRYYDTVGLRSYWEKVDGVKFRRKLRVRHYGPADRLGAEDPVWVEIKQRLDRCTHKRRVRLPYRVALTACDRAASPVPRTSPVIDEVAALVAEFDLRPVTVVGYHREAYEGDGVDVGLRVTFDTRVRGRDRDLDLSTVSDNRLILRPDLTVLEVKVPDRVPAWLGRRLAAHGLQGVRLSKYCQSVEAFHDVPRSVFHAPEPEEA